MICGGSALCTGGAMFAGAVLALVVRRPTRAKTRLKKMLAGRSAIVTGAGRGIGAAVSRLLGQHGASVLVNDLDEAAAHASAAAEEARAIKAELRRLGADAQGCRGGAPGARTAASSRNFGREDRRALQALEKPWARILTRKQSEQQAGDTCFQ